MPVLQHRHVDDCRYCGGFLHYLVNAAPDVLWYDVQDVGGYSGEIFGVGKYKNQILIYENGYGSCSGCGSWGEGGEPITQEDVINSSKLFSTHEEALAYVLHFKEEIYEKPNVEAMVEAVKEILLNS